MFILGLGIESKVIQANITSLKLKF
jgi:hypothetical protein